LVYYAPVTFTMDKQQANVGPFPIRRQAATRAPNAVFNFEAPTTRANAMRVVRAMQLVKPVMLEGSPGVGKTALVTAIADVAGVPLTRINLSEQTDLMDLFGSDAPVQGAEAGIFAWRDAPFLRAMKHGEWVLLDEMNLASQSVLEGLNACLDHRGEVYIPEIGQTFARHPDFRLFAAQNPHHQGGGRKGLPASFVNRFTVVYAGSFQPEDLMLICRRSFPAVETMTMQRAVRFVDLLDQEVAQRKSFGALGGPWEFNLRDIFRWLSLVDSEDGMLQAGNARDFVEMLFTQRFRTSADRERVQGIFASVYGAGLPQSELFSSVSTSTLQIGLSMLQRHETNAPTSGRFAALAGAGCQLYTLQATMLAVQKAWPVILSGSSGIGKTSMIENLANCVGASVKTFAMNAETDAMDLVGGYEQADSLRDVTSRLEVFLSRLHAKAKAGLATASKPDDLSIAVQVQRLAMAAAVDASQLEKLAHLLHFNNLEGSQELLHAIQLSANADDKASFTWIDGVLVDALLKGKWLVLDNANLCSPSVLDRLNSLLEPNGTLIINEYVNQDGLPRVIRPHPSFRIFLTVDPRYGELSRAMRNRALEVHMVAHEGSVTIASPLQPESSMARFRQARALSGLNSTALLASQVTTLLADSAGLCDQVLATRFYRQLVAGLYEGLESIGEPKAFEIHGATGRSENRGRIAAFYELVVDQKQVSADFARVQVSFESSTVSNP